MIYKCVTRHVIQTTLFWWQWSRQSRYTGSSTELRSQTFVHHKVHWGGGVNIKTSSYNHVWIQLKVKTIFIWKCLPGTHVYNMMLKVWRNGLSIYTIGKKYGIFRKDSGKALILHFGWLEMSWHQPETGSVTSMPLQGVVSRTRMQFAMSEIKDTQ